MNERVIDLGPRQAPVLAEADVVVVGGGSAGIAAALAADASGARVVLIERYGFLGGNATSAWVGTICGLYRKSDDGFAVVGGGFAERWAAALTADGMGFGPIPFKRTAVFLTVPWGLKALADRMLLSSGVTTLLHTPVVAAAREGARVRAVILGTKRGLTAVTGSVFIDCSGDADLVTFAGGATDGAGPRQYPSMQFAMNNVDVAAAYEAGLDHLVELMRTTGQTPAWGLSRSGGAVLPTGRPGEVIGAMTRVGVEGRAPDMTDPFEATAAEFAGRAEAAKAGRFLIEHMPGFSEATFTDTPPQLGVRETRRAVGDHVLTGEEVLGAARFDDAVAVGAWPQEFHTEGTETEYVWLEDGAWYQVPYRSLVVRGLDNVLVAGRCLSATHEALASSRVIASSMGQGEAAGIAAALATGAGDVRSVDVEEVRRVLRDRGTSIG